MNDPSTLYKYGRQCHTELLLQMGVVRVGTLYDFRKEEHKRGISDPTEGKNQVYAPLKTPLDEATISIFVSLSLALLAPA